LTVLLVLAAAVMLAVGCQSTTIVPNYSAPPINLQPIAAPELVGDATGSSEGTIILGFITLGVPSKYGSLPGAGMLPACKIERNALYNALQKVPTADALVCPVMTIDETNYFVFKKKKVDVRAKAVKYAAKAL
jgi:hypothetical protein